MTAEATLKLFAERDSIIMTFLRLIIFPIATLTGTIIGVGIFSLPYIASKIGFLAMTLYLLVLGFMVIMVHVFFAEVSLATPDKKRLPGFARVHLGKAAEKLAAITFITGSFGSLLAYLIIGGEFLGNLLLPYFGGNIFFWTIVYFALGLSFVYFGIKSIKTIEFWGVISFFVILFFLFGKSQTFLNLQNIFLPFNSNYLFLPYGPILFSLWGASLIPEIEEMMGRNKKWLKSVIVISMLISMIFYFLFTFLILGVTGSSATESALTGLKNILDQDAVIIGFFFGLIATFTSFITVGLTLKNVFHYDLKMNNKFACLVTFLVPLLLFLIGVNKFIPVISFIGAFALGIEGTLILLMYRKIKNKNKKNGARFFILPFIFIFILGIIYAIGEFF